MRSTFYYEIAHTLRAARAQLATEFAGMRLAVEGFQGSEAAGRLKSLRKRAAVAARWAPLSLDYGEKLTKSFKRDVWMTPRSVVNAAFEAILSGRDPFMSTRSSTPFLWGYLACLRRKR